MFDMIPICALAVCAFIEVCVFRIWVNSLDNILELILEFGYQSFGTDQMPPFYFSSVEYPRDNHTLQ